MKNCKHCLFWRQLTEWEGECSQPDHLSTGIELTDAQFSCEGWKSRNDKSHYDAEARLD